MKIQNRKEGKCKKDLPRLSLVTALGLFRAYLSFCYAVVLSILMQCWDDIQKSFLFKSLYNPVESQVSYAMLHNNSDWMKVFSAPL